MRYMGNATIVPTKIFARPSVFCKNCGWSFRRKIIYPPYVTLQFQKTTTNYTLIAYIQSICQEFMGKPAAKHLLNVKLMGS